MLLKTKIIENSHHTKSYSFLDIQVGAIKFGRSIVYFEGSGVIISEISVPDLFLWYGAVYTAVIGNSRALPNCIPDPILASSIIPRLTPVLKTIFHQCVISYTCGQSNSLCLAIRVRLATSI